MTMPARFTPAERAAAFERALTPALRILADPDSPPEAATYAREVLRKVTALIDTLQGFGEHTHAEQPAAETPHPMTRARMRERPALLILPGDSDREQAGLHQLRQGRDQCTAHRRDGQPCQAPAIPGGLVCRRHGGAAPQVAMKARHLELQAEAFGANETWRAARGTPGEFEALCAVSRAQNTLGAYEAKMERLRELRAEARRRRKTDATA